MNQQFERLDILIEQSRYDEALETLGHLLSSYPNSDDLHYKMSHVLRALSRYKAALEHIDQSIGINPKEAYYYYTKASILLELEDYDGAEENLQTSVEINPHFSDAFAYWAAVKLERKQYSEALELVNESLRLDSNHILGLNIRSKTLLKLKDVEASKDTIDEALKQDPNNAYTHSNYGWNLLEVGKYKEAMEHFKKALEIDPNFSYAQAGMIEALKAKSYIYSQFLKFTFWLGNKGSQFQWGFIIAYYIFNRIISQLVISQPELAFFLKPILYIIIGFALLTWFVNPISNLILRLNRFGRYLLSPNNILNSNLVGLLFLSSLISFILFNTTDINAFYTVGIISLGLAIPWGKWFGEKLKILKIITLGLSLVGCLSIFYAFKLNIDYNGIGQIFIYGLLGYQIVLNKYYIDSDNR